MENFVHMTDDKFYTLTNEDLIILWQDARNEMFRLVDIFVDLGMSDNEIESMTRDLTGFYSWKSHKRCAEKYFKCVADITEEAFHGLVAEYAQYCFLTYRAYDALYKNNVKFYISRIKAFASKSGKTPSFDFLQEMLSEIAVHLPEFFPHYDREKGLKYCTFIGKYLVQPLRNVLRGYATCPLSIYTENLLFKVNKVIDEFERAGVHYDLYMLANRLKIGYKAITEIMNIRSRFDSSMSLDEMHENGTYLPVASSFDVEEEIGKKEFRDLVNRAAETCARKCGDPYLTADIYTGLITNAISVSDVQHRYPHMLRTYITSKRDEFVEYFRKSREISILEIKDYQHRSKAVSDLEDAIQNIPIIARLAVSDGSANQYMDEITVSLDKEIDDNGLIDLSEAF